MSDRQVHSQFLKNYGEQRHGNQSCLTHLAIPDPRDDRADRRCDWARAEQGITAVGASVPGLLAALSSAAMQPGGAQKLADAAMQHLGTPDNLASIIGGGNQTALADKGSHFLASLLGGQDHAALAGGVAKVAGMGQGASNSLLGVLAPVVMGTIAKQQGIAGLDPSNIISLFSAQKDNIAAALPSGLRDQLRGTGLLDALHGVVGAATAAAGQATRAAMSAARAITNTGIRAASEARTQGPAGPVGFIGPFPYRRRRGWVAYLPDLQASGAGCPARPTGYELRPEHDCRRA